MRVSVCVCVCVCICVCVSVCGSGSGKSYTMMGSVENPGLIPRLCSALFDRTLKGKREEESFTVEVSYMEIYNERVRDLLDPKGYARTHAPPSRTGRHSRIHQHPLTALLL